MILELEILIFLFNKIYGLLINLVELVSATGYMSVVFLIMAE